MQSIQVKNLGRIVSFRQRLKAVLGYAGVIGIAVVTAGTFTGCSFTPPDIPCDPGNDPNCRYNYNDSTWFPEEIDLLMKTAPEVPLSKRTRTLVYNGHDVADRLGYGYGEAFKTYHGLNCAKAKKAWTEFPNGDDLIGLRTKESVQFPSEHHRGIVIMNGYDLKYEDSDHKVRGIGSYIFNVRHTQGRSGWELQWEAGGVLSDKNGDDAYSWCYQYTVMMWDSREFIAYNPSLRPCPGPDCDRLDLTLVNRTGDDGARVLSGSAGPLFAAKAVLPLGFGMMYDGGLVDHNFLQAGFDLDTFFSAGSGTNPINWDSTFILKDKGNREFLGTENVAILGGDSVELERESFRLQPRSERSCPDNYDTPEFRLETVTVPDLPYDHVVPMLSGFDIGDICQDNHLKHLAAKITSWSFHKEEGAATGTLSYNVASQVRDRSPTSGSRGSARPSYKVNILGFNYAEDAATNSDANWITDASGVCRDDDGYYPRWSDYNWTQAQCEDACEGNPNCQGFAMSRTRKYCQLFGSDGRRNASKLGTLITRGDDSQPQYTCYLKR